MLSTGVGNRSSVIKKVINVLLLSIRLVFGWMHTGFCPFSSSQDDFILLFFPDCRKRAFGFIACFYFSTSDTTCALEKSRRVSPSDYIHLFFFHGWWWWEAISHEGMLLFFQSWLHRFGAHSAKMSRPRSCKVARTDDLLPEGKNHAMEIIRQQEPTFPQVKWYHCLSQMAISLSHFLRKKRVVAELKSGPSESVKFCWRTFFSSVCLLTDGGSNLSAKQQIVTRRACISNSHADGYWFQWKVRLGSS